MLLYPLWNTDKLHKHLNLHLSPHDTCTRGDGEEIVVQTKHFQVTHLVRTVHITRALIRQPCVEVEA